VTKSWRIGPFIPVRQDILAELPDFRFTCPVSGIDVPWGAKDVFNPGAVVHDGRVHILFRGEDMVGRYAGNSRIGLAVSDDGLKFAAHPEPVLFPEDDSWQAWEWPGGCEDPRVVESPDGGFVVTYTAFDGKVCTLFVATSDDLRHWTKHGPAFASTPYSLRSSKSGSRSSARSSSGAVEIRLRIWLMAWVRRRRAEERATRRTRMDSTFPSLDLASPVASPPWAARGCGHRILGVRLAGAPAPRAVGSVDLDHADFAADGRLP
jgi:hypothetical protein